MKFSAQLFERWKQIALALFHVCLIFVFLNTLLFGLFAVRDRWFTPNPVIVKYGMERLRHAYPNRSEDDIRRLLKDVWTRTMSYDSYTGFRESSVSSTYVHVDPAGFRLVENQAPWPPDPSRYSVFVFGDSTMFGYGASDSETVSSYLQKYLRTSGLPADVYNFGQGRYFSVQQRILFEKLLVRGIRPSVAVFVNGLSDYHPDGEPYSSTPSGSAVSFDSIFQALPIGRAVQSLEQRLAAYKQKTNATLLEDTGALYHATSTIDGIVSVYSENKKMTEAIAAANHVKPLFVWQPSPLYRYDSLRYDIFGPEVNNNYDIPTYSKYTYPAMARLAETGVFGSDFLWAADIQTGSTSSLYVDEIHYAPELAQKLARLIAETLRTPAYRP